MPAPSLTVIFSPLLKTTNDPAGGAGGKVTTVSVIYHLGTMNGL